MSAEKIESSKIPTSLFLLSSVLLTATSRSSLEHKAKGAEVGEGTRIGDGEGDDREEVGAEKEGEEEVGAGEEGEGEELPGVSSLHSVPKSELPEGEEGELPGVSSLHSVPKSELPEGEEEEEEREEEGEGEELLGVSSLHSVPKSELPEGKGRASVLREQKQSVLDSIVEVEEDEDGQEEAGGEKVLPQNLPQNLPKIDLLKQKQRQLVLSPPALPQKGERVVDRRINGDAELDELQELLEFLNNLPIKSKSMRELVETIDSSIDKHNFRSIDALNEVLKSYKINIAPNAISINIK